MASVHVFPNPPETVLTAPPTRRLQLAPPLIQTGARQCRGRLMVVLELGGLKVALAGSAAAVTLAAGGLALTDVASVMASFGGVLVSVVTLSLMARKWLRERRARKLHLVPPIPPIPPPGLPTVRVAHDDFARALRAWEHYGELVELYHIELAAYRDRRGDQ